MLENKDIILQEASKVCKNTLMETLNIEPVDFGEDFLILRMPVNSKVYQPDGVLHGGATAALAESAGSMATHMLFKDSNFMVRGIEITVKSLIGFIGDIENHLIDWVFLLKFSFISIIGIYLGQAIGLKIDGSKLKKGFGYFIIIVASCVIILEIYQ